MKALFSNPILAREVNHRMRDNRTYFVPVIYLSILGLATAGIYLVSTWDPVGVGRGAQGWEIGKIIFHTIAFIQMGLVVLLVPSVSASAVTGERDKGTLVPLLVTPMPRSRITVGKLLAPILYILLLISTSIPFAALSFGFGGTDMGLLLTTYGCLVATALFLASMGLMVSTLMRRTVPAVLVAYGLGAAVVIGTPIADLIYNTVLREPQGGILFLHLNPFTPLVLGVEERLIDNPDVPAWWITPLLQLGLAVLFSLVARARIGSMRD